MEIFSDKNLKRDIIKFGILILAFAAAVSVFILTPALSGPALIAVIITMILSPFVKSFERKGVAKTWSIFLLFAVIGIILTFTGIWATKYVSSEWASFSEKAPSYFYKTVDQIQSVEDRYKLKYDFLENVNPTQAVLNWGKATANWFIDTGPRIVGDIVTWLFIVPILAFFFLKDGDRFKRGFFELVPNRFFESTFMVSSKIAGSLSDYVRAKLIEGSLVGIMVSVGLLIIGAPYAFVLGIIAGVTNIIPYLGPFLGAIPGILIFFFDPVHGELLWRVVMIYTIANVIDMVLIFPVLVAKLVNLHPLVLIAAVIVGQHYYGLVGMLISIPIASAIKVFFGEIFELVYERYKIRVSHSSVASSS